MNLNWTELYLKFSNFQVDLNFEFYLNFSIENVTNAEILIISTSFINIFYLFSSETSECLKCIDKVLTFKTTFVRLLQVFSMFVAMSRSRHKPHKVPFCSVTYPSPNHETLIKKFFDVSQVSALFSVRWIKAQ